MPYQKGFPGQILEFKDLMKYQDIELLQMRNEKVEHKVLWLMHNRK